MTLFRGGDGGVGGYLFQKWNQDGRMERKREVDRRGGDRDGERSGGISGIEMST